MKTVLQAACYCAHRAGQGWKNSEVPGKHSGASAADPHMKSHCGNELPKYRSVGKMSYDFLEAKWGTRARRAPRVQQNM